MRRPAASATPSAAHADVQQLFRYEKAGRNRVYQLRLVEGGSELWVVSFEGSRASRSRRLVTFDRSDDPDAFLQDIRRELRVGGWSEA